ncbi:MAG TPA: GNAT family N-acetyltransferase [Chitinophagaceae bacterium]|nr:GNAT family N-acetyltransferase [Chitinophagaceae bacterium]
MQIEVYRQEYAQAVIDLILHIQQQEFAVPVTLADQPDLQQVIPFYCKGKGNFWIATDNNELVGTIALIDIGNGQSALRKMFVRADYRGKEKGCGQLLLDHVVDWCQQQHIHEIYLGTFETLQAAQRFYLRNGFERIEKEALPAAFPVMPVDNRFFKWTDGKQV